MHGWKCEAQLIRKQVNEHEWLINEPWKKQSYEALSWKMGARTHLFECSSTHYFKRARAPIIQEGTSTHFQRQLSREQVNKCKVDMREISSWNAVLKKWGRAPIILGGTSTHLFGGSSTHYSRRARALIIQRTAKQRTSKWMQNEHERNEFMKCSLEKMRARTHYFRGREHPSFWVLEHPLF